MTATGNAARGGSGIDAAGNGSGPGAALFNLNGNVTIDFSTFAGNFLAGNNGQGANIGPEDGTVYSLAYGNKIQDGSASSATLMIHSSILHGTHADGGLQSDVSVNVANGASTETSGLVYAGNNFIHRSYTVPGVSQSGINPDTTPPLLGALSIYRASPSLLPVLPLGSDSPAQYAADNCIEVDGSSPLTADERGVMRPYQGVCYLGAYQFDGDYIFAANYDVAL